MKKKKKISLLAADRVRRTDQISNNHPWLIAAVRTGLPTRRIQTQRGKTSLYMAYKAGQRVENRCGSSHAALQMKSMHATIMDMDFWLCGSCFIPVQRRNLCMLCCRRRPISAEESVYTWSDCVKSHCLAETELKPFKTTLLFACGHRNLPCN